MLFFFALFFFVSFPISTPTWLLLCSQIQGVAVAVGAEEGEEDAEVTPSGCCGCCCGRMSRDEEEEHILKLKVRVRGFLNSMVAVA